VHRSRHSLLGRDDDDERASSDESSRLETPAEPVLRVLLLLLPFPPAPRSLFFLPACRAVDVAQASTATTASDRLPLAGIAFWKRTLLCVRMCIPFMINCLWFLPAMGCREANGREESSRGARSLHSRMAAKCPPLAEGIRGRGRGPASAVTRLTCCRLVTVFCAGSVLSRPCRDLGVTSNANSNL